jgi:hypothetical protein
MSKSAFSEQDLLPIVTDRRERDGFFRAVNEMYKILNSQPIDTTVANNIYLAMLKKEQEIYMPKDGLYDHLDKL